ncbi:MAG TPA: MlaD family protein [Thermoleophilaceae bacterium]|nr:MlaD family protein [Thermoleophilaceae bacterium]
MRRLLAVLAGAGLVVAAAALMGAGGGSGETRHYKVVFDNAFGLVEGGDFRVGGVKAGQTTAFEATADKPPKARVTVKLTEPGFGDFRRDASCAIKPQSLIGEYYVECQPGDSPERLPNGGTVPVEQTESTIPADLVNNIMRRPYRERLRLIVTELGTGLAGRPDDLRDVLRRAHPGLRETDRVLRILAGQNDVIERFLVDADQVVRELERNKRDVARWIDETGQTAAISASRREQLRETFERLPGFLRELTPTMARLEDLADEQVPLLSDLRAGAPHLDAFLTRLGPFSEASRPALRSLGEASVVGSRAFREGAQEVRALRRLGPKAPPFSKPLRQFLETMDDRRRATDEDGRAKVNGPPASDPSHGGGRGVFTGFEAFWNYFFWQGLSINGYDDVGHLLRASLTESDCSEWQSAYGDEPNDPEIFAECSDQWLGPDQPGITTADPTAGTAAAANLRRLDGQPARRRGERRGPGHPEAGPLPGQPDISRPRVVLPPGLRELLEDVQRPAPGGGAAPDTGPAPNQLLDFLLAP